MEIEKILLKIIKETECVSQILNKIKLILNNINSQTWQRYNLEDNKVLTKKQKEAIADNYRHIDLYSDNLNKIFFVYYTGYFDYPFHSHLPAELYVNIDGKLSIQLDDKNQKQIDLDSNGQSLLINSNRKHRLITEEYFIGLSVWKYKKHDQLGENSLEEISFFSE